MFQLWQHPNGKWYVLYGDRLRKRVSTRKTDRKQAEAFLRQFAAGSQEPRLEGPTVEAILTGYRDDHGKGLRGQDGLKYAVVALVNGLGEFQPQDLTPTVLKNYAKGRKASNGTVLREVGVLRAALNWAHRHKLLAAAPSISNPVPTPPPRNRWLTKDEARKLLAACTEPHIRLFITLGLMTCARMSAILEAKWSQVDWDRRTIDYGTGHGNKRRALVKLNAEALLALKTAQAIACSDYLIEYHGRPVKTVKKGFAAACARAGINGVTPHILRHSGASWAVMEGRPLSEVARMLGDTEATVERVYAKWAPEYLQDTVDALQLGGGK